MLICVLRYIITNYFQKKIRKLKKYSKKIFLKINNLIYILKTRVNQTHHNLMFDKLHDEAFTGQNNGPHRYSTLIALSTLIWNLFLSPTRKSSEPFPKKKKK